MLNKQTMLVGLVALVIGLGLGWVTKPSESMPHDHTTSQASQTWTCSMHPQIQQPESGDCPLCGMDLIPMTEEASESQTVSIQMSPTAMQLANVQTSIVQNQVQERTLRVSGMAKIPEDQKHALTAHITGRIERLMVGFEGETIQQGQILAWVYSPELLTAQKELLEAWRNRDQSPRLYQSVRAKLLNWKMSDKQIDQILKQGTPQEEIPVYADASGTVLGKNVLVGDHVQSGQVLMEVADLSSLWVDFDVYESDLAWVRLGDRVDFHSKSRPDQIGLGSISFIGPIIDRNTRTTNVRVEVSNAEVTLRPSEFVVGKIHSVQDNERLMVPKTSVLWTGARSVVYIKENNPSKVSFTMREVYLGASVEDGYVVLDGLTEGEEVVTHGAFSIDSAAQLLGRPSMMNMQDDAEPNDSSKSSSERVEFSDVGKNALNPLYTAYLDLKTALVNDEYETAHQQSLALQSVLQSISSESFTGSSHAVWMSTSTKLSLHIKTASEATSIRELRNAFKPMSTIMIDLISVVGPIAVPLYIEYCPMADNNTGADWLSAEPEIRNPYFGASMLGCGELKDIVQ